MARGRKTGGRQLGTPNKRTQEVIDRLEALGCDPIEGMARIAMDDGNPIELRGRMFAELAQYVAPKRRAIESNPPNTQPIFNIGLRRAEPVPTPTAEIVGHIVGHIQPAGDQKEQRAGSL